MKKPIVSIVILNYNGLSFTKKCIQSILNSTYKQFHIYVVDNGSLKNEAKILQKQFTSKKITFIRNELNLGFAGGNNNILPQIKTKYVALINNDVTVDKNWLSPLVNILEKNSSVAVVQPKILWMKNKKYFDYSGACGGFIDVLGYTFTKGRIFNTQEVDNGQYNKISNIFWASGAAMVIRNSVFKKIGYFDHRFFSYMEEVDLCFRIQRLGMRILCQPKSVIYHHVAASARKNMLKKRFLEHRNNILVMVKNYPMAKLLLTLPVRLFLEYISLLYYIFTKQNTYARALLWSQASLLFYIPTMLLERFFSTKTLSHKKNYGVYTRSIVWDYFIMHKKYFKTLPGVLS